jgi:hypothetical protein
MKHQQECLCALQFANIYEQKAEMPKWALKNK